MKMCYGKSDIIREIFLWKEWFGKKKMKELFNKSRKVCNFLTYILGMVFVWEVLLAILVATEILGPVTFIALVFMAFIIGIFLYGFPAFVIGFAVAGYFIEKKKQGITEKGFNKKLIPPMLPAFIINCIIMVIIAYGGNLFMNNCVDLF